MIFLIIIIFDDKFKGAMNNFYAIITGDIVLSRTVDSQIWLPKLKSALEQVSEKFDIFRGDSFQVAVPLAHCIEAMFYMKACMKSIAQLDVRMALGIGEIDYLDINIKNSTGESFIYSGEAFDELNKDLMLVKSRWAEWDERTNIILQLACELANKWTNNMAMTVAAVLENPDANQQEIATLLNKKYQSQISTELQKAQWAKIKKAIDFTTTELLKIC